MCGIIGYIGSKPVVPVIIEGLRRLEYRGYDSAGVALVRDGQVEVRRSAGKLSRLEDALRGQPARRRVRRRPHALGDARPADRGERASASRRLRARRRGPQRHHRELPRAQARPGQRAGVKFLSETDTEVVAHLVAREMQGDGLENAVRRALLQLRGLFALVIISADDPEKIVAVRNGPPIVIGLGDGEFFVASDIPAILSHTRDVVFLGDEEMAVITRTGVTFTDYAGATVSKATQRVLWDPVMAEKAGYKHFMLKEIFEQPLGDSRDGARPGLPRVGPRVPQRGEPVRRRVGRDRSRRDRRLRHVLALRARRQVPHRADRAASPSRSTTAASTATASRSSTTGRWPSSSRSRARPPTRWPRCARRRRAARRA